MIRNLNNFEMTFHGTTKHKKFKQLRDVKRSNGMPNLVSSELGERQTAERERAAA